MMTELNYCDLKTEFLEYLNNKQFIVLSTCSNNHVTSRTVCFANDGFVIYLLTGKRMNKCKQIEENDNVALCIDDLQITGKARLIGSPMEEQNAEAGRMFMNKHPAYYERFAHFKVATLIKIQCEYFKQWRMENGRDCYYCLDAVKEKATMHI
jgi:general stress protein 26